MVDASALRSWQRGQYSTLAPYFAAYPSGPWPVVLLEPVAPIEDAVELQYESHLVCAKGNFKLALHVRLIFHTNA